MTIKTDADAVNSAIREPVPELHAPETVSATLQRGLIDPATGLWQVDSEVREMTGADEEYMASLESKNTVTYGEYMSTLLKRTVVRVGSINISDHPSALDNLTIGDRDILFLGVVKATYGTSKDFQVKCGSCEKNNDIVMNLDEDFPIQTPNVDLRGTTSHTLRKGKVVKLRVPTSADNMQIAKNAQSASAQNTLMIAQCAVWEDGETAPADVEAWAKSLNVADRNNLVRSLLEIKAGPSLEAVNVPCAHCNEEMVIRIDWISLLLS